MQQRFCNTPTSSESIRVIRSSVLDALVVMSSVISRLMQLRVATRFARECHKDFSRVRLVENALQKLCNLSHRDSSCTVAMSSNRVILDPHFSPFVLPSCALQLPATSLRRRSPSQ